MNAVLNNLKELAAKAIDAGAQEDFAAMLQEPGGEQFVAAMRLEAAHQAMRWGLPEDREKSAENWFWLLGFIGGKALRAQLEGNRQDAMKHTIEAAACLMHWHRAIACDGSGIGWGFDQDLAAIETLMVGGPSVWKCFEFDGYTQIVIARDGEEASEFMQGRFQLDQPPAATEISMAMKLLTPDGRAMSCYRHLVELLLGGSVPPLVAGEWIQSEGTANA